MKIHFYRTDVADSVDEIGDVLRRLQFMALDNRERIVNRKTMFLERCRVRRGLHEMEFTQRRTHNGPGYSRQGHETRDFDLEENAGFGEQTAAVWSPQNYLAAQYNHYGVRPSAIAVYLEQFFRPDPDSDRPSPLFSLTPEIDPGVYAKFINSRKKTKLICAIDAAAIPEELGRNNVALSTAMELRRRTDAGKVEITLSYGEDRRGGSLRGIRRIVEPLLRTDTVSSLRVSVKEDLDAATEVLDLMNHRETVVVPDDQLELTEGRRLSYQSRIRSIRREFRRWLQRR